MVSFALFAAIVALPGVGADVGADLDVALEVDGGPAPIDVVLDAPDDGLAPTIAVAAPVLTDALAIVPRHDVAGTCVTCAVPDLVAATAAPTATPQAKPAPGAGQEAMVAAGATAVAAGAAAIAMKTGVAARLAAWLASTFAGGIGLFSRIDKDKALHHPARDGLMQLAQAEPGIDLRTCQQRLGVAWGTIVHHVRRLEATGHIVTARHGNHRCLFVAGTADAASRDAILALRGDAPSQLARAVLAAPGATQQDLGRQSGLSAPLTCKYIKRFAEAGLVQVRRVARAVHVEATDQLVALADRGHDATVARYPAVRAAPAAIAAL